VAEYLHICGRNELKVAAHVYGRNELKVAAHVCGCSKFVVKCSLFCSVYSVFKKCHLLLLLLLQLLLESEITFYSRRVLQVYFYSSSFEEAYFYLLLKYKIKSCFSRNDHHGEFVSPVMIVITERTRLSHKIPHR